MKRHEIPKNLKHRHRLCVTGARRARILARMVQRVNRGGERPGLADDIIHYRSCKDPDCARCKYIAHEHQWTKALPIHADLGGHEPANLPATWMIGRVSSSGEWGLGCACCNAARVPGPYGACAVTTFDALQLVNLKKHHRSKQHQAAAIKYLQEHGGVAGPTGMLVVGAPPEEQFVKLWDSICKGTALQSGIGDLGQQHKLQKMAWCLAEALRRRDRDFLSRATCIAIFRDERHAHLSIRFCACDPELNVLHGHLGMRKHFGTGSGAITSATSDVIKRIATINDHGPPRREPGSEPKSKLEPSILENITKQIRMVCVDSASDEVASVRDMIEPPSGGGPIAPNVEALLRDKAHGARRTGTG